MAYFYLNITAVSRGTGRNAVASAAYRAGERLREERTGRVHNHARRRDVVHTEIFVPEQFAAQPLEWARNRERLWNTADRTEKRHNSRVAREFQVVLPAELNPPQRLALARAFSREIAERYGVAVDLAVHDPRPDGDPRNFHAHLLATTREVTPAGLGAKVGIDMQIRDRRRHGLPNHSAEYVLVRERWAQLTNAALREAGLEARVDHRSLAAQGIDREPRPVIPLGQLRLERGGGRSEIAEELRAQYQERVQQRLSRSHQQAAGGQLPAPHKDLTDKAQVTDLEEVRRQAREAWLALRARTQGMDKDSGALGPELQIEDDLSR